MNTRVITGSGRLGILCILLMALLIFTACETDKGPSTENENRTAQENAGGNNEVNRNNAAKTKPEDNIGFTNIILSAHMGMTTVNGEVKNNGENAASFTIKVSFYDKDKKLLGTAVGAVNDLNGGSSKPFSAIAAEDYSDADSCKVQVDTMVAVGSNKEEVITFSNLVVKETGGMVTVDGEATNKDDRTHSFTVAVGLYDENDKLLDVATGAVNDLAPDETKTFTAIATGSASNAKKLKAFVDTIVE